MERLASSVVDVKPAYDVVVVGSGYGGAIVASRLARARERVSVCLLERGQELQPGEFPDTWLEGFSQMQMHGVLGERGPRTGLYDLRVGDDISVFVGCGLGGTSLVNANVSLEPDRRVFQDDCWPQEIHDDQNGLWLGFERARSMLRPTPYPKDGKALAKLSVLETSAGAVGAEFDRAPINVTFKSGKNHVGVRQHACTLCGDCVSGCNYGAKNTLMMNYLPDARAFGADIFTHAAVRKVERRDGRWCVTFDALHTGREAFGSTERSVLADVVVLAAGSLGSTEILLRSRESGLTFSDQLGARFTGNGDVLAFNYNGDADVNGIGWGPPPHRDRKPVGPCITGIVDLRRTPDFRDGMVIEEGSIPGALAHFLPGIFGVAAIATDTPRTDPDVDPPDDVSDVVRSLIDGPYRGAMARTQTYLVMSHDDGAGRIKLDNGAAHVVWPGVGGQPVFERIREKLARLSEPLRGEFIPNPTWTPSFGRRLVTVHPLGGCVMGPDASRGVVNHKGQVYADAHGTRVHDGLYVVDGSVIPRPLGVNPLLTISALAERSVELMAKDRGWTIDYNRKTPKLPRTSRAVGFQFTERMTGFISTAELVGYAAAEADGRARGSTLEFTMTIQADDLDMFIRDPNHVASMAGTVTIPMLSREPLQVNDGEFNLFRIDPEGIGTRVMTYDMTFTTPDHRRYALRGRKTVRDDRGLDVWPDTTRLMVTLHDLNVESHPAVAAGVLRISPADLVKQMSSIRVTNARNFQQRLWATARFGKFFAGTLYDTYGGVFAGSALFDPSAPARHQRTLRVDVAPKTHPFKARDGVPLCLTRYQAGRKGPVMLCHGLGVSSRIFTTDTVDTNLLEFLCAHGYDVWLLDYRASIDLPASTGQFNADTVAANDYPAAIEYVLAASGAPSVQMVVHCFGSVAFFMAMLRSEADPVMQRVRAIVASQVAMHLRTTPLTRAKATLRVPRLMLGLGIQSLTAYTDRRARWKDRLVNATLKWWPLPEGCPTRSAVCHRISFLYDRVHQHAQLNDATHRNLHEMFGVANVEAFKHLATMVRAEQLVRASGDDDYMAQPERLRRLNIPITFIHGSENVCFLPESTRLTEELLRQVNVGQQYQRHVIPDHGHLDCIYGKNAVQTVYPHVLRQLDATPL